MQYTLKSKSKSLHGYFDNMYLCHFRVLKRYSNSNPSPNHETRKQGIITHVIHWTLYSGIMQPAQIYSRINYGIEVYGKCAASYMSKIQTLQNKLMKMLLQLNYSTPTDDLHAMLNILKVNYMFKTNILSFVNFFMYHQCFMIISNIRRLTMIFVSKD